MNVVGFFFFCFVLLDSMILHFELVFGAASLAGSLKMDDFNFQQRLLRSLNKGGGLQLVKDWSFIRPLSLWPFLYGSHLPIPFINSVTFFCPSSHIQKTEYIASVYLGYIYVNNALLWKLSGC